MKLKLGRQHASLSQLTLEVSTGYSFIIPAVYLAVRKICTPFMMKLVKHFDIHKLKKLIFVSYCGFVVYKCLPNDFGL